MAKLMSLINSWSKLLAHKPRYIRRNDCALKTLLAQRNKPLALSKTDEAYEFVHELFEGFRTEFPVLSKAIQEDLLSGDLREGMEYVFVNLVSETSPHLTPETQKDDEMLDRWEVALILLEEGVSFEYLFHAYRNAR